MQEPAFRKTLSRAVRKARRERGLTQRDLSDLAHITEKYLSRIERGQVTPSTFVTFRICSALNTDLGQLVSMRTRPERRSLASFVRLLRGRSDDDIDRARRIVVELFR